MAGSGSLARRAILAIALMIGFYVLALVVSAALALVPVVEYQLIGRVDLRLAAPCLGGAGAILWALVPRRDRFEPPGPALGRGRYPQLFALIDEVAAATRQAAPAEVYALNQINAFVTHRGGVMGLGSRRVMGLGLPLVQHLGMAELKAVIGHEFGHYDSGDVALGPWIYKTRATIGRTLEGISHRAWLSRPFQWYGGLFLRLTHAVSRQQEFVADTIGARVAGTAAMASALQRVAVLATAYTSYLQQVVEPSVNAGRLPPLLDGFTRFLHAGGTKTWLTQLAEHEATFGETQQYDTHPSLPDRLAALASHAAVAPAGDDSPAASLVPDADAIVQRIVDELVRTATGESPAPMAWDDLGQAVVLPAWRESVRQFQEWLALPTADALPRGREAWLGLLTPIGGVTFEELPEQAVLDLVMGVTAGALGVRLAERGWTVRSAPGEASTLTLGGDAITPRDVVRGLVDGTCDPGTWRARCDAIGLAGVALMPSAPHAA